MKIWLRTRNYVQRSILDSARRTSHVPLPAISSFGGLRTPAPECVAPSSWAGIRKPSQNPTSILRPLLGPDRTEIGLRRSLKFLRDSIVDPSAYINPEYRSATVVPRSGAKVRGVVLNEDDYSIQLRDTREELRSFLKSDLKEVQREKESLMPSYKSVLSETEINDLVARLNSLRGNQ